jgi:hypothetical protein
VDLVIFASFWGGGYSYACDFIWDGLINLGDLVIMAQAWAAFCP